MPLVVGSLSLPVESPLDGYVNPTSGRSYIKSVIGEPILYVSSGNTDSVGNQCSQYVFPERIQGDFIKRSLSLFLGMLYFDPYV